MEGQGVEGRGKCLRPVSGMEFGDGVRRRRIVGQVWSIRTGSLFERVSCSCLFVSRACEDESYLAPSYK